MVFDNNKNYSIKTRLKVGVKAGVNPPKTPTTADLESRPVEIPTDPPDSAEMLAEWGIWLAELTTYAPWSRESSAFVDRAIASREGGEANG